MVHLGVGGKVIHHHFTINIPSNLPPNQVLQLLPRLPSTPIFHTILTINRLVFFFPLARTVWACSPPFFLLYLLLLISHWDGNTLEVRIQHRWTFLFFFFTNFIFVFHHLYLKSHNISSLFSNDYHANLTLITLNVDTYNKIGWDV